MSLVEFHNAADPAVAAAIREITGVEPYEDGLWTTTGWFAGFDEDDCSDPIGGFDFWEPGEKEQMVRVRSEWKDDTTTRFVLEAHFQQYFRFLGKNEVVRKAWDKYEEYLGEDSYEDGWRECSSRGRLEKRLGERIKEKLDAEKARRAAGNDPIP
jgi:hypothetical protein